MNTLFRKAAHRTAILVGSAPAFVGARMLAETKKTNRERDHAVIGELARLLAEPRDHLLYSRSARDLAELADRHPDLLPALASVRPLLAGIHQGRDWLEAALDAERRELIRANERRLSAYLEAAEEWERAWPRIGRAIAGLPLGQQHRILLGEAPGLLAERVEWTA